MHKLIYRVIDLLNERGAQLLVFVALKWLYLPGCDSMSFGCVDELFKNRDSGDLGSEDWGGEDELVVVQAIHFKS
jgi:hypothetical protein